MKTALRFLSRSALTLAVGLAWLPLPVPARAAPPVAGEYKIHDSGQDRVFEVSREHVWVQTGTQRKELRKIVPAASPQEVLAAAEAMQTALGQPAGLVLIERGVPYGVSAQALLTRQVLAKLGPAADAQSLATRLGAVSVAPAPTAAGWWLFTAEGLLGAPDLAAALRSQPGVSYSEPQLERQRQLMFVPDDLFFQFQWHLMNTGQSGATPGLDVAVTNVWDTYRGNGIVFGIIDTGTETTHPDLLTNMVAGLGYDFFDGDNDPSPLTPDEAHGTSVSGVAAARGNNSEGVAGAAFNAGLVSERLIVGSFPDSAEAGAFLYQNQVIDLKNNSWGWPEYIVVAGPGPLSEEALRQGVTLGRGGRGVIYTFATGNGREYYGNANFSGYPNSRYTIAVTGCDDQGGIVSYATPGSCVNVAAPTGDSGRGRLDITTTDRTSTNGYNPPQFGGIDYVNQDYTRTFNGTSSATPLASGVIGLILEANPNLGWRDVQEIVMRSARVISPASPSWQTNAAGFHFNYDFGAGMIQAEAGVALAQNWENLAPETNVVYAAASLGIVIPDNDPAGVSYDFMVTEPNLRLEHVQLGVNISHSVRGDLEIDLISPSGVVSRLATPRPYDPYSDFNWTFMTVFNWGEDSVGRWTIHVSDRVARDTGVINDLKLTLYGVPREAAPDATAADLSLRVVGAPDPVLVGNTLTYSVTLTNSGMITASNVVVHQNLPLSTVYLNGNSPDGAVNQVAGLVTWTPTDLLPGGSASMTVRVLAAVAGTQFSTVTATNSTRDSNPANNTYIVSTRVLPLTADLGLTLNAQPNPALVGGTLTYNLTVTNRGPSLAAGTVVTVNLPATVAVTSLNSSQGTSTVASNVVTFSLGGVANSGVAALSVACRPLAPGNLITTAKVASNLPDPIRANNTASASTAVSPAADLVIAFVDYPDPAVLYSNFYYFISVTNRGPNPANNVTLNQTIPAGVKVVSNFTTQGSVSVVGGGGTVIGSLGTLGVGASASLIVTAVGMNVGTFPSAVTVSSAQADADAANNSANVTTEVALPYVSIVPAGATLKSESLSTNGAIDLGEAVTVEFRLRNAGNVRNTNLVATLLPGGGVTNITLSPQTYGVLTPGGLPEGRLFGFTATGTNGGTVTAQFRLTDGGAIIGTNTFVFALPRLTSTANPTSIAINDNAPATPYPSTISIAGLTGVLSKVVVTLSNLNHTYPEDMQVLLVGPGNNRVLLMANAGGGAPFAGATIKFDDAAPSMADNSNVGSGSYHPSSYGSVSALPTPAPGLPYASDLAAFNGLVPNGLWSLYVVDTASGDFGVMAGGWSLQLYTVLAVNQLADLSVAATAAPNPVLVGSPLTFTYTVTNAGPNTANAVLLTNLQPVGVALVSALSDQGVCTTNGNLVTCVIPSLAAASKATLTVVVKPLAPGAIAASVSVSSAEVDLNPGNNQTSASATAQLPVADLALTLAPPLGTTVVQGSNVTYTISLTNQGPQNALSAALVNVLGAFTTNDFAVLAVTNTSGAAESVSNSVITASWGDLLPASGGTVTVTLQANAVGYFTNTVGAVTGSLDPATNNNQAGFILTVVPPMPKLTAAGATLLAENLLPPNGSVNPGETVTVSLALQNLGELTASNVVGTLAASGGITAPSEAQTYGELAPGATPVARTFTFTATGSGPYLATLQLTNNGVSLGSVQFTFYPPASAAAASDTSIFIPEIGTAYPYPSTLPVAGLTGLISRVTVTLSNLSHTFPDDLDVLLVSPNGTKLVLMSDVGGNHSVSNVTLTFSDTTLASLPDNGTLVSGTYRPTDNEPDDLFVSPAPDGPLAANLAAYNGEDPNGTWGLYVIDDSAGDHGSLAGWSLNFTLVQPLNPVAGLSVTLAADPLTASTWQNVTFTTVVANAGPDAASEVNVTNALPAGLKFISASSPQGTWTNTPAGVAFALGNLDAGAQAVVTVIAQPLAGGSQTVQARVAGAGATDLDLADNLAAVVVTTAAPPPAPLLAAQYQAGTFTLQLKGQPNASYGLESSSTLDGTWSAVTTLTTDAQGNASWSAPSTLLSPNFYRTVQHP